MTALSFLLFSCFQAFFVALSRPIPLSHPPFVTNLLRQPVSDLFQFYAAFSLPSRLISFSVTFSLPSRLISFSATFSLPYCLIPFFAAFSLPYCLIPFLLHSRLCPALFHFLSHSHFRTALFLFCCILASVPPYSRLLFATFSAFTILSVYISLFDHSVRISCIHQKYLFHRQILLQV